MYNQKDILCEEIRSDDRYATYAKWLQNDLGPWALGLLCAAREHLGTVFENEHYQVVPGMELVDLVQGVRFRVVQVEGMTHILELLEPIVARAGVHRSPTGEVRAALWGVSGRSRVASLLVRIVWAFAGLITVPEAERRAYRDDRVVSTARIPGEHHTVLKKVAVYTLLFRRRTFQKENVDRAPEVLRSLVARWESQPDAWRVLEEEGGGVPRFRIFVRRGNAWGELEKEPPVTEVVGVAETIRLALHSGYDAVMVTLRGNYVPREYEGLPACASPAAHYRRLRCGYVIVLPAGVGAVERAIAERFRAVGYMGLSESERRTLSALIKAHEAPGIHHADGKFSPGDVGGRGPVPRAPTYVRR